MKIAEINVSMSNISVEAKVIILEMRSVQTRYGKEKLQMLHWKMTVNK